MRKYSTLVQTTVPENESQTPYEQGHNATVFLLLQRPSGLDHGGILRFSQPALRQWELRAH